MKKNLLLFFLLTFIGYACDSSEDTAEASFTIEISGESNPTTFDMGPDKHSETISVKSNASWKIDKPQTAGWLRQVEKMTPPLLSRLKPMKRLKRAKV